MNTFDIVYLVGVFLTVMGICSFPAVASLSGGGPRYRAVILRQLIIGWAVGFLFVGWMTLGWLALGSGGRWVSMYRDCSFVLMGAFFPVLFIGISAGKRAAAAAQAADRDLTA